MANKLRTNGKKTNSILKLKVVMEKLQKSLLLPKKTSHHHIPQDVKQGHFAVIAADDQKLKRFVVPLTYLTHPLFTRLLEQAAEEFGFDQEGALMVPCSPSKLERLLQAEVPSAGGFSWGSSNEAMVKSC